MQITTGHRRGQGWRGTRRVVATGLIATLLTAVAGNRLGADMISVVAAADATVSDANGDSTFEGINSTGSSLTIRQFQDFDPPTTDFEDRAVLEFSLAGIPVDATIDSLTFNFTTIAFTSGAGDVGVFAYSGNGTVATADATVTATQIGSYDSTALGLGPQSVSLSTAFLQSVLGSTSFLGLRLQGIEPAVNTSISSTEAGTSFGGPPPTLVIQFTPIPEPSSLALAGVFGLTVAAYGLRRRRQDRMMG